MKKLLKLLSVITIGSGGLLNVIACGNNDYTSGNKGESKNTINLLKNATLRIEKFFYELVNSHKNLFNDKNFLNEGNMLAKVDKLAIGEINDCDIKNAFLNLIMRANMPDINHLLSTDKQLQPLFYGLNINELLRINFTKSEVIKNNFHWRKSDGVDFGLENYNEQQFQVTSWNSLTFTLKLRLSFLHDKRFMSHGIKQKYTIYFTNSAAHIKNIIIAASYNVEKELQKLNHLDANINNFISLEKNKSEILQKLNYSLQKKPQFKKIEIKTNELVGTDFHDLQDYQEWGISNFLRYTLDKEIFLKAWNARIMERIDNFALVIDKWKKEHHVIFSENIIPNIYVVGSYQTTNWTINGLVLKTFTIPYFVTSPVTHLDNIKHSLNVLAHLFVGLNPLFRYGIDYGDGDIDVSFVFILKQKKFDDFITNNVFYYKVFAYITSLIKNYCQSNGLSDDVEVVSATVGAMNKRLNQLSFYKKNEAFADNSNNVVFVINGIPFNISLSKDNFNSKVGFVRSKYSDK